MSIGSVGGIHSPSHYSDNSGIDPTVVKELISAGNALTNTITYPTFESIMSGIQAATPKGYQSMSDYLAAVGGTNPACGDAVNALNLLSGVTTEEEFNAACQPDPNNYHNATDLFTWTSDLIGLNHL